MSYTNKECFNNIKDKNILFLDLETTGLVKNLGPNNKPEDNYPKYDSREYDNARIVQIGYKYTKNFKFKQANINHIKSIIIKPNDFIITNSNIHGITTEYANEHGNEIDKTCNYLYKIIKKCDVIKYLSNIVKTKNNFLFPMFLF